MPNIQIQSPSRRELTLNGHLFTGFANVDDPIEYTDGDEDLITTERGKDGQLYGMTEAFYGGHVTVHLHPTSPSVQWLLKERELLKNAQLGHGRVPIYNGSDNDGNLGDVTTLSDGVLKRCPARRGYSTFSATFEFELIESNVDGARFAAAPGRSSA